MDNQLTGENYYANRQESPWGKVKGSVARQLSTAAHKLHEQTARGEHSSEFSRFGSQAADWLERSADYVNDLEPQQIKADLESTVRRNPGRSLLVAGLAGLVIGKLLRRR